MNKVIVIGAGPAGLAAGYYLAKNNVKILVLEKENQPGGICKTIEYKGCRFDIGGHRFFTDIAEIERLWYEILGDKLLKRPRLSRIYYNNKFFDYPLSLTNTVKNLGLFGSFLILASYLKSQFIKEKEIVTFEDYITKYFGKRLFKIFFKVYTEKVWGIPCTQISADWARQRIAGLSVVSAITDALIFGQDGNIRTLVKQFHYPVLGPGMMYEEIAENVIEMGGEVKTGLDVISLIHNSKKILCVVGKDKNGRQAEFKTENLISSMPLSELIQKLKPTPPQAILESSRELKYRDLLVVNLICSNEHVFPDNWVYVHSPEVALCRIQNYKNWSPAMVSDKTKTPLGLEYFCLQEDKLWNMEDEELIKMAQKELKKTGFTVTTEDGFVQRVTHAYPVYSIGYKEPLKIITDYLAQFDNLQTIGRAGRFRYDNMDEAIISGVFAAGNIIRKQEPAIVLENKT